MQRRKGERNPPTLMEGYYALSACEQASSSFWFRGRLQKTRQFWYMGSFLRNHTGAFNHANAAVFALLLGLGGLRSRRTLHHTRRATQPGKRTDPCLRRASAAALGHGSGMPESQLSPDFIHNNRGLCPECNTAEMSGTYLMGACRESAVPVGKSSCAPLTRML